MEQTIARVIHEEKNRYRMHDGEREFWAEMSGRLYHQAQDRADLPAVGDWVIAHAPDDSDVALIQQILERQSKFSRNQAGDETREQIVAANIDTVFLVTALNQDFNLRRLERYLVLSWESGASPVVVLTKADLCDDPTPYLQDVASIAMDVPVHVVSALAGTGLDALDPYLGEGHTIALLGSSGAGKSTLVNALIGEDVQITQDIREDDDKGRHTTTSRKIFFLPQGGLLLDTPGMREIQLWEGGEGLQQTFQDIEDLAEQCRFRDCQHNNEPGCAIRAAIGNGTLDPQRLASYRKLDREIAYLDRKQDEQLQQNTKRRWKAMSVQARARAKERWTEPSDSD